MNLGKPALFDFLIDCDIARAEYDAIRRDFSLLYYSQPPSQPIAHCRRSPPSLDESFDAALTSDIETLLISGLARRAKAAPPGDKPATRRRYAGRSRLPREHTSAYAFQKNT